MLLPGLKEWIFSGKAFVGAMVAVYVAYQLDLAQPQWSMMTAYIVAQPLAGMVQSKAFYRGVGTIIGSFFAIIIVTEFVTAPEFMTFILALWVALCVYMTVLEKSPRSYMLMLSGYTVVIIASQSVNMPDAVFDIALSRCQEILLGITCAILANNLIFPQRAGPVLKARLDMWLDDAARLISDILNGQGDAMQATRDFNRLTSDAIALDAIRVHAAYDTPSLRAAEGLFIDLRHRMQEILPLLVGIKDRLETLQKRNPELYETAAPLLEQAADWIKSGGQDMTATIALHHAIAAAMPSDIDIRQHWDQLLLRTILQRLTEVVDSWGECRALRDELDARPRQKETFRTPRKIAVHRDHFIAALSGVAAAISILLTGAFWIMSGWTAGSPALMMAAVGASLFASFDDPGRFVVQFLYLSIPAAIVAGIYEVAIFPAVNGFPMLVLVLAPLYLLGGALMAMPAYVPLMMPLALGCTAILPLSNTHQGDFETFVNGAIAQTVGLGVAAIVLLLIRRLGAEWSANRLLAATRRELGRIAGGTPKIDRAQFEGRMTDRIAALVPRLAGSETERRRIMTEAQAGLRMGINILMIQQIRVSLAPNRARAIGSLLRALQRHYSSGLSSHERTMALVRRTDNAIRLVALSEITMTTNEALIHLGGIRHSLLSHSLMLEDETSDQTRYSDPLERGYLGEGIPA